MTTKTKGSKKGDADALAAEVEGELSGKKGKGAADPWVGKTVRFKGENGEAIEGPVIAEKDGLLTVDTPDANWEVKVADATVVKDAPEDDASAEAPAEKKKGAKGKKGEPEIPEFRFVSVETLLIPKDKPREFVEDEKFKGFCADIERRGVRDAIKVSDWDKPFICEGLRRYHAAKKLGITHLLARIDTAEDKEERILNGTLDNINRQEMHWLDLARVCVSLTKNEKYTNKQVGKYLHLGETEVSRMIAALKLPEDTRAIAAKVAEPSVFLELTSAPKKVQAEFTTAIAESIEKGKPMPTVRDVRARKKEVEQAKPPAEREKRGGNRNAGKTSGGTTFRRLSPEQTGDAIKVTVHKDAIEFNIRVPHENKTAKGFEVLKQIKAAFDSAFSTEGVSVQSFDALCSAITAAKSEIL